MGFEIKLGGVCRSALLSCAVATSGPAQAAGMFKGPVEATVVEIIDGDTFLADAQVWPGHSVRVNIRIRGIDAPEMKARCAIEKAAALRAREALAVIVGDGRLVISNIGGAKYYGRVLADVATPDGQAVAALLLGAELVRALCRRPARRLVRMTRLDRTGTGQASRRGTIMARTVARTAQG